MVHKTTRTQDEFLLKLAQLLRASQQLDEVMDILFESLDEHGFKPTSHMVNRRERLNEVIKDMQDVGSRTMGQFASMRELVRISALLTSSLNLDEVLEDVMDTVVELTGAERAYLMLYDEDRELQVRAARNWDQETISKDEVGLSQSVVQAALEDQEYILTTNAQADHRFMDRESIIVQKLRSIICIPLILGGTPVGVLYADNRLQKGVFKQELVPILKAFGGQASIAIANAQFYQKVQDDLGKAKEQIRELQISVDEGKVKREVSSITETPYFQELVAAAREMRKRQRERTMDDE